MPQISSGQAASLVLEPGESYTISATGVATVKGIYGAPATTTTLNSNFAVFGPYGVPAKLDIACTSGAASYTLDQYEGDVVRTKNNPFTGVMGLTNPSSGAVANIQKKPSNLITRVPGGSMTATAGTAAGNTWHVTAEMPGDFDWVRLVYRSLEVGPIVLTSAGVAVNDGLTAYPGYTGSFLPVTFGGAAKGTMPPRVAAGVPSVLMSDWMPIASLARLDGGTLPLLVARTYVQTPDGSGAGSGYSYNARMTTGTLTSPSWRQSISLVDGVGSPASFLQTASTGNGLLAGIQVMSRKNACTVSFVGDSVQAGQSSSLGVASAGYLACAAVTKSTYPVVYSGDAATNGSSPAAYWQIFNANVSVIKPKVAFYQVSSINEAVTSQAIQDKHYAYAMRFIQDCYDNDVIPVLQTCWPQNRGSAVNDAFRKGLNDRIRAFASSSNGVLLCDADAAVADPAAPHQYLAAYNSGDNSHMNDAGYAAAAVAMQATLLQAITL